jgi:hypothetical protein
MRATMPSRNRSIHCNTKSDPVLFRNGMSSRSYREFFPINGQIEGWKTFAFAASLPEGYQTICRLRRRSRTGDDIVFACKLNASRQGR